MVFLLRHSNREPSTNLGFTVCKWRMWLDSRRVVHQPTACSASKHLKKPAMACHGASSSFYRARIGYGSACLSFDFEVAGVWRCQFKPDLPFLHVNTTCEMRIIIWVLRCCCHVPPFVIFRKAFQVFKSLRQVSVECVPEMVSRRVRLSAPPVNSSASMTSGCPVVPNFGFPKTHSSFPVPLCVGMYDLERGVRPSGQVSSVTLIGTMGEMGTRRNFLSVVGGSKPLRT